MTTLLHSSVNYWYNSHSFAVCKLALENIMTEKSKTAVAELLVNGQINYTELSIKLRNSFIIQCT